VRCLLDTHTFLWWLDGDPALSILARSAIAEFGDRIYVSAVTAWEISTKFRIGKLPQAACVAADIEACILNQSFLPLPITARHGTLAGSLPGVHRDPFDRMLIAQALMEDMALVSNERIFDQYGVKRYW
jgi:PIN domain nuclease of toxin-antitoxin system